MRKQALLYWSYTLVKIIVIALLLVVGCEITPDCQDWKDAMEVAYKDIEVGQGLMCVYKDLSIKT